MNRRQFLVSGSLIAMARIPPFATAKEESTPTLDLPIRGRFLTPLATSVTDSGYSDKQGAFLLYRAFSFENADDATEMFSTFPSQITDWIEGEKYYEIRFSDKVSIGEVGDDRLGYLSDDTEELNGVILQEDLIIHFVLDALDPVAIYGESLISIFEEHSEHQLDLDWFPIGWSEVWTDEDVSSLHIPK